jgi:cold shock CspA family protein
MSLLFRSEPHFGFPVQSTFDIFAHISELDLDPSKLAKDDLLSFEIEPGHDGRPKAVKVRWAD